MPSQCVKCIIKATCTTACKKQDNWMIILMRAFNHLYFPLVKDRSIPVIMEHTRTLTRALQIGINHVTVKEDGSIYFKAKISRYRNKPNA